jgi:hypothetical protein
MQKARLNPEFAKDGKEFYVTFTRTPLDIAPLMNTGVFEPMESVVCTSATLKIGKRLRLLDAAGRAFVLGQRPLKVRVF